MGTLAAKWAAESFVEETAKSAFASLKPVYDWIAGVLNGEPASEGILDRLWMEPEEATTTQALAGHIEEAIREDPALKAHLEALIKQAKRHSGTHSFVV